MKVTRQQIVDCIRHNLSERGMPPTLREMCDQLGLKSAGGLSVRLDAMAADGIIERDEYIARGIRVLRDAD